MRQEHIISILQMRKQAQRGLHDLPKVPPLLSGIGRLPIPALWLYSLSVLNQRQRCRISINPHSDPIQLYKWGN